MDYLTYYSSQIADEYFNENFTNSLYTMELDSNENKHLYNPIKNKILDTSNTYNLNSLKFRSKEFNKDTRNKFLFNGCSFTYGMGVLEDHTWAHFLSKENNYVNLSQAGSSVESICKNTIRYIEEYENVEYVMCLFPDIFRINFLNDNDFHTLDKDGAGNFDALRYGTIHLENVNRFNFKSVKNEDPVKNVFSINKSISPHYSILKAINEIYNLEKYCKAKNIIFVWSSWSLFFSKLLEIFFNKKDFYLDKNNYINFFKSDYYKIMPEVGGNDWFWTENICEDDHNLGLSKTKSWLIGTDKTGHPGVHYHYHVAKMFEKRLNV
jgi:hypothetical protein